MRPPPTPLPPLRLRTSLHPASSGRRPVAGGGGRAPGGALRARRVPRARRLDGRLPPRTRHVPDDVSVSQRGRWWWWRWAARSRSRRLERPAKKKKARRLPPATRATDVAVAMAGSPWPTPPPSPLQRQARVDRPQDCPPLARRQGGDVGRRGGSVHGPVPAHVGFGCSARAGGRVSRRDARERGRGRRVDRTVAGGDRRHLQSRGQNAQSPRVRGRQEVGDGAARSGAERAARSADPAPTTSHPPTRPHLSASRPAASTASAASPTSWASSSFGPGRPRRARPRLRPAPPSPPSPPPPASRPSCRSSSVTRSARRRNRARRGGGTARGRGTPRRTPRSGPCPGRGRCEAGWETGVSSRGRARRGGRGRRRRGGGGGGGARAAPARAPRGPPKRAHARAARATRVAACLGVVARA
jgi:hypothetical protein